MTAPIISCPSYTEKIFDVTSLPLIVRWAENILRDENADAIVACGHSGLLLAGALSYITCIPVFAVRKEGEKAVASDPPMVSGVALNGPAKRWVWVDDFMSSGGTFRRSRNHAVNAGLLATPHPVAILSYGRGSDMTFISVSENDADSYTCDPTAWRDADFVTYKQYGFREPERQG